MIGIDLSKQQECDADPKEMQQISFIGNLDWAGNEKMFFIIEEVKESILNISRKTAQVLWIYFALI